MADIRTEREILELLKAQTEARKDLAIGSKEYNNIQKSINKLEVEKRNILKQQKEEQSKLNNITVSSLPIYKQIEASIKSREVTLKKTEKTQSSLSIAAKAQREAITQQGKLLQSIQAQSTADKGNELRISEAQFSAVESLSTGTQDIASIQEEIAKSKARAKEMDHWSNANIKENEQNLQSTLNTESKRLTLKQKEKDASELLDKITGGMASKATDFRDKLKNASPDQKKFMVAVALITVGVAMVTKLVSLGKEFAKTFDDIGKQFGSVNLLGDELQGQLLASNIEAIKLGGNINDVGSITSTLASNFGMSLEEASALSVKVLDTSMALGLSADEGAQLFGVLTQTANLSAEQAEKLSEGAAQLARQKGVAPAQVMKDIAGSAETVAQFTKEGGNNIFDAAIAARQFGLNLDSVANAAKGSLDFESSLTAEVEASVMLGKQLNLQKAREAALNKDLVGFQKEIKNQLGGIGDFSKLNTLQQESLAKALGMNVAEVAKLANGTAKIGDGLAGQSFDDLLGEDAISSFTKLSNSLSSIGATIVQSVGPALGFMASGIVAVLKPFGAFMGFLDSVGALMPMLVVGLGGVGVALTALGVSAAASVGGLLMNAFATIGTMVANMSLASFGLGSIPALALGGVLTAGVLGMVAKAASFDDLDPMKGAVVKGGTQNKAMAQIQGGEGVFNVEGIQKLAQPQVAQNLGTPSSQNSDRVMNNLAAAVDGLVNNGVGIKGEFSNFGDAVSFSSERSLGSVGQIGTRPI